jgi:membrane-associated protease RseP (regulator of RpoE activity)
MKGAHWGTIALATLLIVGPGPERDAKALDPEPTVDEQFQDQATTGTAPSELPPPSAEATSIGATPNSGSPGYLGVTFDPSFRNAAVVRDVHPGSPAELAGLQPGDVIEQLNGRPIRTNQDVINDVARMRAGDVLDISFSRRITTQTQAALDSRPAQNVERAPARSEPSLAEPVAPGGRQQVRANRPTYDNNAAQQRSPGDAQMQRRGDANRNDREPQRERGFRFRGFGRR